MKRVATAVAAVAVVSLMAAPAFAATMAKPDIDGMLKQVFHGKPGWWMADMKMPAPMGMKGMKLNFPMLWPHKMAMK